MSGLVQLGLGALGTVQQATLAIQQSNALKLAQFAIISQVQGTENDLLGQISNVSSQVSGVSSSLGGLPDSVAFGVWNTTLGPFEVTAGPTLSSIYGYTKYRLSDSLDRYYFAPDFLIQGYDDNYLNDNGLNIINLVGVNPSDQEDTEDDATFLNRVTSGFLWVNGFRGTRFAGTFHTASDSGEDIAIYYVPLPPSLNDIIKLFQYTPSSGPPKRSVIKDMALIASTIPIQWGGAGP